MSAGFETAALGLLLLVSSLSAFLPRLFGYRVQWFDALMLVGITSFVWSFLKFIYIVNRDTAAGIPLWSISDDYANGVVAILLFSLLMVAGYISARSVAPEGSRPIAHTHGADLRLLGLSTGVLTLICALAFVWILLFSSIDLSWDNLSSKRFLDEEAGPAGRFAQIEYLAFKIALSARIPLYALAAAMMISDRPAPRWMVWLCVANLAVIVATAFIFSNRANVFLVAVDLAAIATVLGKRIFNPRVVMAALAVFVVVIWASELRAGGETRTTMQHIFEARSFIDVERTDRILDYSQGVEKWRGATFLSWLGLLPPGFSSQGGQFANLGWAVGYHVFGLEASGVPISYPGELIMNFGYPGLCVGAVLFGIIAALLAHLGFSRRTTPWVAVAVALIHVRMGLFLIHSDVGTAALKTLVEVVPTALVVLVTTRRMWHAKACTVQLTPVSTSAHKHIKLRVS